MNPADFTTRRAFLHRGLTLVGAASTAPLFLARSARAVAPKDGALTRSRPGVPDDHVLVVLQLAGGNDGLNTVIPVRNDLYYKYRPQLGIAAKAALKLNDDFALHPVLTGFKSLYDAGLLAVVHGVGYPNPNRSHFKSMDIWHTASPDGREHTGWIGRYFDNACRGEDPCDPQAGVAIMNEAPLAMQGERFRPVAFQRPEDLNWNPGGNEYAQRRAAFAKRAQEMRGKRAMQQPAGGPLPDEYVFEQLNQPGRKSARPAGDLGFLQRTAMDARLTSSDIQRASRGQAAAEYPGSPLANTLKTVARMIAAQMPTKIYYVSQGGYDTHAGQANRQQQLLTQLGDALKAFVADLTAAGQLDRVTIMTFSEFGRRVTENASGGTDHGEAAPMFVVGKHITPGFHGTFPSLDETDLHRGDLAWTTDFRNVYAGVLQGWLCADAKAALGDFQPLPLIDQA